jgi:hypothetical protein
MSWLGFSNTQQVSSSIGSVVSPLSVEANNNKEELKLPLLTALNSVSVNGRFGVLEETKLSKFTRPFLLANEASSSSKRTKNSKNSRKSKPDELAKVYTDSNPPPSINNFVKQNIVYKFSESIGQTTFVTTSTTLATFAAIAFTANQLDEFSALAAVFDQYKIDEIEVWIEPLTIGTGNNSSGAGGYIYTCVDYDDANVPSTLNTVLDYQNVCMSASTEGHYHRFKPHVAVAAYSGTFTSFLNMADQWVDCASPNVQHYGIKGAVTTTTASTIYNYRARFHISFRNLR